jgi:hypothetical protein
VSSVSAWLKLWSLVVLAGAVLAGIALGAEGLLGNLLAELAGVAAGLLVAVGLFPVFEKRVRGQRWERVRKTTYRAIAAHLCDVAVGAWRSLWSRRRRSTRPCSTAGEVEWGLPGAQATFIMRACDVRLPFDGSHPDHLERSTMLSRTWPALALMLLAVAAPGRAQTQTPGAQPLEVGVVAPDFALPGATRYGVLKEPVRLSDFKGKTVVLAFFFRARTPG